MLGKQPGHLGAVVQRLDLAGPVGGTMLVVEADVPTENKAVIVAIRVVRPVVQIGLRLGDGDELLQLGETYHVVDFVAGRVHGPERESAGLTRQQLFSENFLTVRINCVSKL